MALLSADFPLLSAAIASSDLFAVTDIIRTESNDNCRNGRNGTKFCAVEWQRLVMASKVVARKVEMIRVPDSDRSREAQTLSLEDRWLDGWRFKNNIRRNILGVDVGNGNQCEHSFPDS